MKAVHTIGKDAFNWQALKDATEPFVVRGLLEEWPLVTAAARGNNAALNYLRSLDKGVALPMVVGDPAIKGRIGYNADMTSLNCRSERASMAVLFENLTQAADQQKPPLYYIGTAHCETVFNGFTAAHGIDFGELAPDQFIWIGNRSCISAHYDVPDNLACNAVGRRRFTLFPPEQIENLYVGPLDFTPAGQAISLVDIREPDLARFPKYAAAEAQALEVTLAAGDALYIPSLWWHHVEGLDDINMLVNYWWRTSPPHFLSPVDALSFAMASVRDLPPHQKKHWQSLFQRYVFEPDEALTAHIPQAAQGSLGTLTANITRQLRAKFISRLNR